MAKERLIPRKIVYGLGVIAALSLGTLEAQRIQTTPDHRHIQLWEGYMVSEGDKGFNVTAENGDRYEFPGEYNGLNKQPGFVAVGVKKDDQCAVAIILPHETITLYDEAITPYRITSVKDDVITYYTLEYYQMFTKEYDRQTETTRITSVYEVPSPWYSQKEC